MMGDGIGLENLRSIVRSLVEASVDTGVADATSAVDHLDDSAKSWPVNAFTDLIIEITGGTGEGQIRKIASNTATSIVPVTNFDTAPNATSTYRIGFFGKMSGDITSWGGTALTGRDISLDLAKLDIALSALRDTLRGAGTKDFTTLEADIESILAQLDVALSTRASETTLAKLIPIAKAAIFNTALPTAEADWLTSAITPTNSPSYLRIYVCVSVSGVLRVARTIGATTITEDLNSGGALAVNAAYMFTVPWRSGDSINLRYSVTTGTIYILRIEEIGGIG
jgi:hypothetical protein